MCRYHALFAVTSLSNNKMKSILCLGWTIPWSIPHLLCQYACVSVYACNLWPIYTRSFPISNLWLLKHQKSKINECSNLLLLHSLQDPVWEPITLMSKMPSVIRNRDREQPINVQSLNFNWSIFFRLKIIIVLNYFT